MKKLFAGLAGAIAIGFFASGAQAASFAGAGTASSAGASSEVIQVHGLHSSCRRDRFGWHRSHVWGRQHCAPAWLKHHHHHHHHYHHKKHWKKH